jgi:hypothetical protein
LNASVAGGAGTWGTIGGTLTDQTDLVIALGLKSDTTHHHDASYQAIHDHSIYALLAGRAGDILKMDTINEVTAGAGVTVDGLLLKDSAVGFANYSILQESGKLVIKYGTTTIASFSSAGALIAKDEVTAFGTP